MRFENCITSAGAGLSEPGAWEYGGLQARAARLVSQHGFSHSSRRSRLPAVLHCRQSQPTSASPRPAISSNSRPFSSTPGQSPPPIQPTTPRFLRSAILSRPDPFCSGWRPWVANDRHSFHASSAAARQVPSLSTPPFPYQSRLVPTINSLASHGRESILSRACPFPCPRLAQTLPQVD